MGSAQPAGAEDDISAFLAPVPVPTGGIHLMNGANGRPSGLAYVELSTEAEQKDALAKDKQSIGGRYIDIFSCSQNELQARLAGGLERGWHGMNRMQANSDPSETIDGLEGLEGVEFPDCRDLTE